MANSNRKSKTAENTTVVNAATENTATAVETAVETAVVETPAVDTSAAVRAELEAMGVPAAEIDFLLSVMDPKGLTVEKATEKFLPGTKPATALSGAKQNVFNYLRNKLYNVAPVTRTHRDDLVIAGDKREKEISRLARERAGLEARGAISTKHAAQYAKAEAEIRAEFDAKDAAAKAEADAKAEATSNA